MKMFNSKSEKNVFLICLGSMILVLIFVGLFFSGGFGPFNPSNTASFFEKIGWTTQSGSSAQSSREAESTSVVALWVILAGLWWLVTKIWPFILLGLCFALVSWGVQSMIRSAIEDALNDYFVQQNLKELIKEAIQEAREEVQDEREAEL